MQSNRPKAVAIYCDTFNSIISDVKSDVSREDRCRSRKEAVSGRASMQNVDQRNVVTVIRKTIDFNVHL